MRILILAHHFAPEEVSGAVLATELASDLARRGHSVCVVTCAPNYPDGRVFAGYGNLLLSRQLMDGVEVIRVWSFIAASRGFWSKLLSQGTFSAAAIYGGLAGGRADVIFCYSPPLPLGVAAWVLAAIRRIPWVLRVEDLYPDAAVAAGVLRNRVAIRFFGWLERLLYRRANHISLISEGFRRNLLGKTVASEKLTVTPVWADPDSVQPLPKENAFRHEHGLSGAFVVLYAGALGHTSALEDVLDAAALLTNIPRVRFVIVGEGVKKAALEETCSQRGLNNVLFLPFQPRKRFAEMLAAADVSLVTLNAQCSSFSLPSKTFNIMASARPILSVAPPESEIAQLVADAACGVNVPPGRSDEVAAAILALMADGQGVLRRGNNGRKRLEETYSRATCVDQFEATLLRVSGC